MNEKEKRYCRTDRPALPTILPSWKRIKKGAKKEFKVLGKAFKKTLR